jgi:hypothetical protein
MTTFEACRTETAGWHARLDRASRALEPQNRR